MLLAGMFYPKIVTALGICIFAGREAYMNGYLREGPNSKTRLYGGIAVLVPEIMIIAFLISIGLWRGFLRGKIAGLGIIQRRQVSLIERHMEEIVEKERRGY